MRLAKHMTDVTPLLELVVAVEEVSFHRTKDAERAYHGYLATVQTWCEEKGNATMVGIAVGTAKKAMTGKGHASKDDMLAAARLRFPEQNVGGYDQADALAVMLAARQRLGI